MRCIGLICKYQDRGDGLLSVRQPERCTSCRLTRSEHGKWQKIVAGYGSALLREIARGYTIFRIDQLPQATLSASASNMKMAVTTEDIDVSVNAECRNLNGQINNVLNIRENTVLKQIFQESNMSGTGLPDILSPPELK